MAINPACYDTVARISGRELPPAETKQIGDEIDRRASQISATEPGIADRDALIRAADEFGRDARLGALIDKQNALMNERKRLELDTYLANVWSDRPTDGLDAVLTGVQRSREGARRSVAAEQNALQGKYAGGLITDLGDRWKLFATGSLDDDIARAMWKLDDESPDFVGLRPEAIEIAKSINKWQEIARQDANREGAFIGKEKGYITRQSHDVYKIRRAKFEKWRDTIAPKLDLARMRIVGDLDDYLRNVYKGLASGIHLKADTGPKLTGFKGPGNLAKRVSAERVLHFKSADDWMAYNNEFGTGSLREAVFGGLRKAGQSTGLLRILGTNPENMVSVLHRSMLERIDDPAKQAKFAEALNTGGEVANRLAQVDGSVNIPGNEYAARISANTRAIQSMAKLGGAVISSVTDIPVYASEVRYQGRSMLSGMAEALGGLMQGRPKGERAQVLSSIGVTLESMIGEITRRGSLDDTFSAGVSRGMQRFFKYNLLNWWTESLRSSAALGLSHFMAKEAVKSFDKLDPQMQRLLGLYKIDEPAWNKIRASKQTKADGRDYLTPDDVEDRALGEALRSFYVDRAETAVIEPDAATMAMMRQGTRPGTAYGELLRFISQFKSFSVAFTQRVLGREAYGYGADTLGQAIRNGESLRGLTNVMLMTTLFGYGAMAIKDLLKGKEPHDPKKAETWGQAMLQGGGLGIYGDFLLGEASRTGGGTIEALAGPAIGTAGRSIDLYHKARAGDDASAEALRLAISNTPFANLFYTRMALDYAILYEVQESMNPGYLRRMERRIEKDTGQEWLIRPSEVVQ